MRVLVCGSRDWTDTFLVNTVLDGLWRNICYSTHGGRSFTIIEGGAKGADSAAKDWVDALAATNEPYQKFVLLNHFQYKADWNRFGKGAGAIRNKQMLTEGKPSLVLAFKNGLDLTLTRGGTENMIKQAKKAGVMVYHFQSLTTALQLGMIDQ